MTQDEFNGTKRTGGMIIVYGGQQYPVASVCFVEMLIGYATEFDDELSWVRCENVELIDKQV